MKYKALVAACLATLFLYVSVFAQSAIVGTVTKAANLRAGPGTTYAVVGTVKAGQVVTITEKNAAGTWYHLDSNKWIASFLVKVKETPSNQNNLPDTQGCYLFQNQLDAELTVTAIRTDTSKRTTFKVPSSQEKAVCLEPGRYSYTLDAPPWASVTGQLDIKAGDRFFFPVRETAPPDSSPTQSSGKSQPDATPTPTATPLPQPTANPNSGQRYGAICRDGSTSNATGRGACSHHGGVDHWLVYP